MKKAINAWTIDSATDFETMFRQIKTAGFDAIELNLDQPGSSLHSLTLETTEAELQEIAGISRDCDLPVCSISTSLYGGIQCYADPDDRKAARAILEKQLLCAAKLGATGILVPPGGISDSVSISDAYKYYIDAMMACRDLIDTYKINVALENVWNTFFLSPFDMRDLIDKLDCRYITAYYDVGNTAAFSYPEYWIEILGKRITNIHIKDFKRNGWFNRGGEFVDLHEGDIKWDKVVAELKGIGFDGYLTAEVSKNDESKSYEDYYKEIAESIGIIIGKGVLA